METWDPWAQVRCDSLDLFQISVDCDITGASASGEWVITLIGQVYFNFCPYMVLLTVYSATSLTSTKTLKNQKYTTIWKKKEEFLPFPFLILEEVWTLKCCNPFLKVFLKVSQRSVTKVVHTTKIAVNWRLTRFARLFYVFMTSIVTPRAFFVQRLGNFSK